MTSNCGTYAGYQHHRRNDEDPCADCKTANTTYIKQWRARNRDKTARHRETSYARVRAMQALAKRHPEEFQQLYNAERLRSAGAP